MAAERTVGNMERGRRTKVSRPTGSDQVPVRHGSQAAGNPAPALTCAGCAAGSEPCPACASAAARVLAAEAAQPGGQVPQALLAPMEDRLRLGLGSARLHAGPEVSLALDQIGTHAASLGRHLFVSDGVPAALAPPIIAHELVHAAQTGLGDPDLSGRIGIGPRHDPIEQNANRLAHGGSARLTSGASPNVVRRREDWDIWAREERREAQERERRERLDAWRGSVEGRVAADLSGRATTASGAIEQSEQVVLLQRGGMFEALERLPDRGGVPADLPRLWTEAEQAVLTLGAATAGGAAGVEARELARRRLVAFYETLAPTLEALEADQQARQRREQAEAERANRQREETRRLLAGDAMGGRAAAAGFSLANPPRDYYRAPTPPPSPAVRAARSRLGAAPLVLDAAAALADYRRASRAFDELVLYRLGPRSDEGLAFTQQRGLLERQQALAERQPYARPIPAVFYPELQYVDQAPQGQAHAALGIPWQLYLDHTGFQGHDRLARAGGEWVLEDLTPANRTPPTNREPSSDLDVGLLQQGAVVDPPWALFERLNSALRFPRGRLVIQLPSGQRRTLETTEPMTLSRFLMGLGIVLALAGLFVLSGGWATLAFAGAAASGVGSTLADLSERSEQGLLTEGDVNRAMLFIAADLASALTLGLGRVATVATRARGVAGASSLLGRYVVPLTRAARVSQSVGMALNVTTAIVASEQLIAQARLIQGSRMSEAEKRQAMARLALTGLLTLSLTTVSVVGDARALASGRAGLHLDVDADGRPLLRSEPAAEPGATHIAPAGGPVRTAVGAGGGRPPAGGVPAPEAPLPERARTAHEGWVEETLRTGMGPTRTAPAPAGAARLRQGTVAEGVGSAREAYRHYEDALARAPNREVGMYRNVETGEYAVRVGSELSVMGPTQGRWETVLHYHPNPENVLTHRMPAPQDIENTLWDAFRSGRPITEFVEYPLAAGRRGRAAYTVTPEGRVRVEYEHAQRGRMRQDFDSIEGYVREYGARTTYLDPDSPTYQWVMRDLDDYYRARGGRGGSTAMGAGRGPGASAPPTARALERATGRFGRGRPGRGDLATVIADVVADFRAYLRIAPGAPGGATCTGYCHLAKGQVVSEIMGHLESSGIPVRVDAMSASALGEIAPRRPGIDPAAASHQFTIVRAGADAYIVDPTFAQFLRPGSAHVGEPGNVLAPGFLDTPAGRRFASDLVSRGYVPLTPENAALYARALALDLGPVGGTAPGPVGRMILAGTPHYSTLRFEASGGAVRFVEPAAGAAGAPSTEAERETRRLMLESIERPQDLVALIRQQLGQATATTPEALAAAARLRLRLQLLEDLTQRYTSAGSTVDPWRGNGG